MVNKSPKAIKTNQNSQLARERTEHLLKLKIGSLSINLLRIRSDKKVIPKKVNPKSNPDNNPDKEETLTVKLAPVRIHIIASARRPLLKEGRKNSEE